MIERTVDADLVSRLGGHDFSEFVAEPLNVCLIEDSSLAFFAWRGPGIYELHLALAVAGRAAIDLLNRMLDVMRDEHGARFMWAMIPTDRRNVRLFARWMGWKSLGLRETRHGTNELFSQGNI